MTANNNVLSLYSAISKLSEQVPPKPETAGKSPSIWSYGRGALRLAMQEKEIFLFAALQWLSIVVAFLVCIEVIKYIPEFQKGYEFIEGESHWISNAIILTAIFLSIAAAALPVGVLTGAMAASHFLRRHGRDSTISSCMAVSAKRVWRLWVFHTVDGAVTVFRVLDRLSKKENKSVSATAIKEASYFAWKVACASAVPTLLLAKDLSEAVRSSTAFMREDLLRITALRAAYSGACWVVAFITAGLVMVVRGTFPVSTYSLYEVFLVMSMPFAAGLAFVMLFLRPIYVLSLCDLYSNFIATQKEKTS